MRCARLLCARKDIIELLVRQGRLSDIQMLNFFSIQLDRELSAAARKGTAEADATAAAAAAAMKKKVATAVAPHPPLPPTDVSPKMEDGKATATATPAAAETVSAAVKPDAADDAAAAQKVAEAAKAAAKAAQLAQSREAKKKAWTAFHQRSTAVRQLATTESPIAWLGEVYGKGDEWSSSFLSSMNAVATQASQQEPTKLRATGLAIAVGSGEALKDGAAAAAAGGRTPLTSARLPKSIRVVLRLEEEGEMKEAAAGAEGKVHPTGAAVAAAAATPTYVTASVRLDQPGVVDKKLVNGMLRVRLDGAEAIRNEALSARQVAGYQHVLTATAYSAILRKVEEVCALHATNTVRYDALLLRNPAVQMRLAQLACFRYGIDCLTDYVVGDPEVEEGEEAEEFFSSFSALLQMPLIESMALNIYAERALMDSVDGMWEMVRDTPLVKAVPHRSNPEKMIDYPYLAQLLNSSKYVLTASDGSMEEQALAFLSPLLSHGGAFGSGGSGGGLTNLLQGLAGLTRGHSYGGVRLAAPHVNLAGMARQLEHDVARLLHMISTAKDKTEPMFVICVAQYISEVLANLAVIYRCTAALNVDEDGRGHREWLLAQAFGGSSAVRRQRLLDDYSMSCSAAKVLRKSKDLDNYSTHPVELMNASPRNGKAAAAATHEKPVDNKAQK
ncbi:putative mitochondrial hypothetical protein [Leptomonas pyrrhocoris]|uniref:Uncharacterized protein n=1 Tax=Leptomonas pyrrhocoris TaxID=157538 RepID=A0A0M9FP37_LEPPY|nr:putative mitochondrial hypothetical protein [Leptomonas pyrrhocoris]XP_015651638.1 putative mitochondrial hypothetical protein [Leptomonas pyrrhocoris]XP_015651639.1 putative mitochondrial hypothetical protein [Leptomonas pyrrhocoris]KPA73198.1 putative mitochondrial hypothetical protein [Leptomonas pyrrhocoris]KPA73199.1 putative mitochondrial hypothetical protein [Leptomonas pyrrhocoris]KPA73200.1 putative mitochondrial hypothetical protein [Leptomonas pyrrhocoris]|eukprot:XP_015651637.1 putative mitochondrial hypothetical protein [Leptomonas pyrrhocoris]